LEFIEVLNWEKYQGGSKRYESTTWFKMENKLWMNELWDALSPEEFKCFIFLLCYVSQKSHKTGRIEIEITTLSRMSGISSTILDSTVQALCKHGVVTKVPHVQIR